MGKAEEFHATPQWEAVEPSVAGRPATRKDAEKALAKRLKDLHDGKLRGSHASHVRRVFGNLDPGIRRAEVASRTLQTYRSHFDKNILPAIGSKRIDRISTQDIQRLKTSLSHLSAETVRKHLALLRQMFNHAIDWGYVLRNPARKVRLPTVRRERVKPWNPAELRQFLDAVPEDWYAYFLCVISGGLRIGESLAMRWRNLDWEGGRYHVKESVRRDGTVGPPKTTTSIAWVDPDARGDQGARSPQSPPERTEDRGRGGGPGSHLLHPLRQAPARPQHAVELMMALYQSARNHEVVRLPLEETGYPLSLVLAEGKMSPEFEHKYDIRSHERRSWDHWEEYNDLRTSGLTHPEIIHRIFGSE